jgi:hypothetical protein
MIVHVRADLCDLSPCGEFLKCLNIAPRLTTNKLSHAATLQNSVNFSAQDLTQIHEWFMPARSDNF